MSRTQHIPMEMLWEDEYEGESLECPECGESDTFREIIRWHSGTYECRECGHYEEV